jgi:serine/threonine protein phosphatase PrpC
VGKIHIEQVDLRNYDRILVASDGLWDNALEEELVKTISSSPIGKAIEELAILAERRMLGEQMPNGSFGNRDNLSLLLYEILPADLKR